MKHKEKQVMCNIPGLLLSTLVLLELPPFLCGSIASLYSPRKTNGLHEEHFHN
jgi:hypothetical protein